MNPLQALVSRLIVNRILDACKDIPRPTLEGMSIASQLDFLFLLRGHYGSIGNFWSTQKAVMFLVGEEAYWRWPEEAGAKASANNTVN